MSHPRVRMMAGAGEVFPTLDWNPALGFFTSTKGPTPSFTRASGATCVDATGKVVWGPENLLHPSLPTNSGTQNITIRDLTSAVVGSDGPEGLPYRRYSSTGGSDPAVYSSDMPTGGHSTLTCYIRKVAGAQTTINVSVGAGANYLNLGSGEWRKLIATGLRGDSYTMIGGGSTWLADLVLDVAYMQLERGSESRAYVPTTTTKVYSPRITYDPVSHECLGYLAEEQRTNELINSATLSDWAWGATAIVAEGTAPDGSVARKIQEDGANTVHLVYDTRQGRIGTYSIYVKAAERTIVGVAFGGIDKGVYVNLTTGAVVGILGAAPASYSIVSAGNGWWRVSVTDATTNRYPMLVLSDGAPTTARDSYTGIPGYGIYAWGAQFEAGSFPTSYIPTAGAAVTRSADVCQISGSNFVSIYNQNEGTVVSAVQALVNDTNKLPWSIDNGSYANRHQSSFTGTSAQMYTANAGSTEFWPSQPFVQGGHSLAFGYKLNDYAVSFVGAPVITDNVATVPIMDRFNIGCSAMGDSRLNSTISRIRYYPSRLPDTKLVELTDPLSLFSFNWNPASGSFASTRGPTPAFTRASGATMVDVAGNVVWGPENLTQQSDIFENVELGVPVGVTKTILTSGAPIMGRSFGRLTETAVTGPGHYAGSNGRTLEVGQPYTWSVFLKAGTRSKCMTGMYSGGNGYARVNLLNGTLISADPLVSKTVIQDAGNGWWRVAVTFVPASATAYGMIGLMDDAGNEIYLGDPSKYIDAFGSQLERGTEGRPYLPTTTAVVYGPRITYDPVTHECLGYLAEEQRTNLCLRSSELDNTGVWGVTVGSAWGGGSIANNAIAPDGTMTAEMFAENASGTAVTILRQVINLTASSVYTMSLFAKFKDRRYVALFYYDGSSHEQLFDLQTGTMTAVAANVTTASITPYPNGWYRLTATFTVSATPSVNVFDIRYAASLQSSDIAYPNTGAGNWLWGAQLELGTLPTSYIPTAGASSTRSGDLCEVNGANFASIYNQLEGTTDLDIQSMPPNNWNDYTLITDGGSNETGIRNNISGHLLEFYTVSNGSPVLDIFPGNTPIIPFKGAVAYKASDHAAAYNGAIIGSSATGGVPVNPHVMRFGSNRYGTPISNALFKRVRYHPMRLSDAKLIEATTPGGIQMDFEATAYIRAVAAAKGSTVTTVQQNAINAFILAEKAAGRWPIHKRIYLPIWANAAANAIDMITRTSGTWMGTVTHSAGFVLGDNTSGYFDMGVSPAALGMTVSSSSLTVLIKNNNSDTLAGWIGTYDVGNTCVFYSENGWVVGSFWTMNTHAFEMNGGAAAINGILNSTRNATTSYIHHRKTSGFATPAATVRDAPGAVPTTTLVAMNIGIGSNWWAAGEYGAFHVGLTMTPVQVDAFTLNLKTLWETTTGLTLP